MRRRIVGLTVFSVIVAIVMLAVPLSIGAFILFLGQQRAELTNLGQTIAVSVSDDVALGRQIPELRQAGRRAGVGVYDAQGAAISGYQLPNDAALIKRTLSGRISYAKLDGKNVVVVPVGDGPSVVGAVLVAAPLTEVYAQVAETCAAMVVLGVIIVLLCWLLARRQAARLARPLERLSETATRLGEGDFDAQSSLVGIEEIDSVSRSMNEMASRIGSTMKRERAFSSNVSHQLRTPLTALRVTIEAALDEPNVDARGALRDGLTAVDRLQTTVTDMLTLTRDGRHASRPLDVPRLLADVRDRWSPHLRIAGRTLQIHDHDVQAAVSISDVAARQILNVLVENAAQHGHGTVTIRIRDAESTVAIDVSQDGPSLDANAQLFVRDANRPRGRGIGLTLARGLAESEGSRLNLTNIDPPTFTLMIPRINGQAR